MKPTWISPLAQFGLALDDLEGSGHVGSERFLAQHGLGVLEAGQQLLFVRRARRCEYDGVDVGIGDRIEGIGDRAAARNLGGDPFGLLRQVVVDDGHLRTGDPGA
jgi:hypothetical protein